MFRLLKLKELRQRRAEAALRVRQAALDAALATVDTARANLYSWQGDQPRQEAALYDPLIGEAVDLLDIEEVKSKIVALREHSQLLEKRLEDAEAEAGEALHARDEAQLNARERSREFSKFERLIEALRAVETSEAERLADLDAEDFANAQSLMSGNEDDMQHHAR